MRSIYHVSLLCLSLATSIAGAEPPTISAPEKTYGEVGDWVEIKVQTNGKWVRYVPQDAGLKSFPNDRLKDTKSTWVSATVPGYYRVLAYTGNDEGGAEVTVWVKFGQSGVIPTPPVPPTPVPPTPVPPTPIPVPPVPVPIIVEAWVIVVEETSQRTPAIAAVLGDLKFWNNLPLLGWRFYDKDSPDAKKHKYDQLAAQEIERTKGYIINDKPDDPPRRLPLIMVIDGQGKLIRSKNLPTDTAVIREFIRQSTGR